MTHPRVLRHRGAVKASLAVLAVLLICQAAIPISQTQNESSSSGRLGEDGGRRLGWFGGWGGGAKEAEVEPNQEDRGPAEDGEPLGDLKGDEMTQRVGEKPLKLKPIADVEGAGAGLGDLKAHPRMHPIGAKLPHVPISETVDLEVPQEGLLWQPTSMSPLKCGEAADAAADECEATITFCLMRMAEYQETPWKYPMAVMLQKKSGCSKAENLRSFRLSDLRTYMREHPEEFLQPNGFVYHETRTGSTLVANMLAHVPSNLVVSENNMAEDPVRRCSHCTEMQKVALLREIMTLLGNGRNGHKHLFFKFQDSTTLPLMMKAYPEVGWVYLFRDPVEVMVSNLKGAYGKRERFYKGFDFDAADHDMNNNNSNITANHDPDKPEGKSGRPPMSPCLMSKPPSDMKGKPKEEICADRLRTLCQAAVDQLEEGGNGAVVEYTNLPDVVTEYIYPVLFGMGDDKLKEHLPYLSAAAGMYSKSMSNPESEFKQGTDAGYKHVMAEKAYQDAAEATGLSEVYRKLQGLQTWHKRGERR